MILINKTPRKKNVLQVNTSSIKNLILSKRSLLLPTYSLVRAHTRPYSTMFRFRKFCPFQTRSPIPPPDHDSNFINYDPLDMSFLRLERTELHEAEVPAARPNTSRGRVSAGTRSIGRCSSVKAKKKKKGKLIKRKKVLLLIFLSITLFHFLLSLAVLERYIFRLQTCKQT